MPIPNRFSKPTDEIHAEILDEVRDDVDKRQGSVVYDMTAPTALESARLRSLLDIMLLYVFVNEDQPREYLERKAGELGVYPTPATHAVGELTFEGDNGVVVPAGTRASTDEDDPVYFVTTEDGVISGGSVTVSAEAEEAGAAGNVSEGDITLVLGDLTGVVDVTNNADFEGGANEESDESLLERYYRRAQRPATSGNPAHYEQWALEVSGVGNVRVLPVWDGPNTVKVVLLGDDARAPDSTIVANAAEHIEEQRPIMADVTVEPAPEVAIDVQADVVLASGATLAEVTADFNEGLDEYLASLAYNDALVRYTQISGILLGIPEIIDFDNLTVNGGTSNVEIDIDAGEVAVRGGVSFDEQPD